jgi:hypothetical protein
MLGVNRHVSKVPRADIRRVTAQRRAPLARTRLPLSYPCLRVFTTAKLAEVEPAMITDDFNCARYRAGQAAGHYESYFQRANHPTRPQAFWVRYTIFSPAGRPRDAIGELWAVVFNGDTGRHVVAKSEVPIDRCAFSNDQLAVRIADSELAPGVLVGRAGSLSNGITWNLGYRGGTAPVFDLPLGRYDGSFPKAKALVGVPMARFTGAMTLNDEALAIDNWVGSQNHNWGAQHTDRYAWGQVCGFDDAPDSFLETASARLKIGPIWSKLITPLVLRHAGKEFACNSLWQGLRARASYDYFHWRFASKNKSAQIEGEIRAPREAFVGLRYYNPPGGVKYCLNSKIASCTLHVTDFSTGRTETLRAANRAAFEILTDDADHGIGICA